MSQTRGTRLASKQQSELQVSTIDSPDTRETLETLHTIFSSSFGPWGKSKLVHNSSGGHVMMTSSASRLLSGLSPSKPIARLITTAIQGHVSAYGDGGSAAATLSLGLIRNALRLEIHRHLVMDIYDLLLTKCLDYLASRECSCRISLDLGDMSTLLTLIKNVIGTKPACGLTDDEVEHVGKINLEAYIKTLGAESTMQSKHSVLFVCVEGTPPSESRTVSGVLFETPHIPVYRKRPLELRKSRTKEGELGVRVALFNVSLAGDAEDAVSAVFEIPEGLDVMATTVDKIKECVDGMTDACVGVVLCQKVVHPAVKGHLTSRGVLVLDRLGSQCMTGIQALTGAVVLGTFETVPPETSYGWLDDVRHIVMGRRSYLQLVRSASPVTTVVLCNRTENSLDELKHVSIVAQDTMRMTLHQPEALPGGGCWQTHLSGIVRNMFEESWCQRLGCSRLKIQTVVNAFSLSLEQVAMELSDKQTDHVTNVTNPHHWVIPRGSSQITNVCACGMYKLTNENRDFLRTGSTGLCWTEEGEACDRTGDIKVLDLFVIGLNVLKSAVSTANMVLGIAHYVHDIN